MTVAVANQPIVCIDQQQCGIMWARAEQWVEQNTNWRIQIANNSLISTYGPDPDDSPAPAYTVTREPMANGQSRIELSINCGIKTLSNWPFYDSCTGDNGNLLIYHEASFAQALNAPLAIASHY